VITHATCLFEQLRGIKRRSFRVEPHLQSATIQASGGAEPLRPARILNVATAAAGKKETKCR
jgi:hypothetical protein